MSDPSIDVQHDERGRRFQAVVDGHRCVCEYRLQNDAMALVHTEVPPALEGRGIASALVRAAFDHAEAHGLKVLPLCSYVHAWVRRHPEVVPLVLGVR